MTWRRPPAAPATSWSYLYYDLAMVAAIVVLSYEWAADHSALNAVWLTIVFGVIWSTWVLSGLMTGGFTKEPPSLRGLDMALLSLQMVLLLLVALSATSASQKASDLFGILTALAVLLTLLLGRRGRSRGLPVDRPTTLLVDGAVALLVLAEVFVGELGDWYAALWLLALALIGVATWRGLRSSLIDPHRLGHRLGELTTIVIGETLLKIALTADEKGLETLHPLAVLIVLGLLTVMWWDYFSDAVRRPPSAGARRALWSQSHFLLHLGLIAAAVGLGKLAVDDPALEHGTTSLLVVPVALVYLSLTLLDLFGGTRSAGVRATIHALTTVLVAGVGSVAAVALHWPPLAIGTVVTGLAAMGTLAVTMAPRTRDEAAQLTPSGR